MADGTGTDPDRTALKPCLSAAHRAALRRRGGKVASYIPELGRADPERFALSACTVEGQVESVGDVSVEFTLQSVAKPFVYGLALERFGPDEVHRRVGVEPTGEAFDALVELDPVSLRPHNPLINAGAICITGLFCGLPGGQGLSEIQRLFDRLAGRSLKGVDYPTYLSEREAGDRNRAMAHLLRHAGALAEPVAEVLDLYFKQCSLLAGVADLAVMAATLAGGGRNPVSGERVFQPRVAGHVLTLMATCGLYDRSGRFLFDSGMPAKSGVSGALVAVAPGRLGLASYSAPLDPKGNSVRGVTAVRRISAKLALHALAPRRGVASAKAPPDLGELLLRLADEARGADGGEPAAYLPPPAAPETIGVALCSVAGQEYANAAAETPFSIQAVANALVYALVRRRGRSAVHRLVGCEPSGNPYYAIRFDRTTRRPYNPLGNAGAIAVCSLVPGSDPGQRLGHLLDTLGGWCGAARLLVDPEVHRAEVENAERNLAIASLLRHFGLLEEIDPALELYQQQCAIGMNCRQLARVAAMLAGGGTLPGQNRRVLGAQAARDTVTLMLSCGLHDQSGKFAFDAGLPAKSGVSGGIMAVVPGRWGIAVYSPRVNAHGASVRGMALLTALAQRLGLGVFDTFEGSGDGSRA